MIDDCKGGRYRGGLLRSARLPDHAEFKGMPHLFFEGKGVTLDEKRHDASLRADDPAALSHAEDNAFTEGAETTDLCSILNQADMAGELSRRRF